MILISCIFIVVVSAAVGLFFAGLEKMCLYLISNSHKTQKTKKIITIFCRIFVIIIILAFTLGGITYLSKVLCATDIGSYIAVIIYTLLLALMSSNMLYISPSEPIDSVKKAFRKGFTGASVNHIVPNLYLKTIINLAYVIVLILAQLEDLGFAKFSKEMSYFCTLNKYGIVIVFAMEKIIKSFKPENERAKILVEAFVEQENHEEKMREERKKLYNEVKSTIRERRRARKIERKKRKKGRSE